MRGDQEIVVVVRRGPEFLVMRRAPERLGYWCLVAGGFEPDESPTEAAQHTRERRRDRSGVVWCRVVSDGRGHARTPA